MAFSLGSRLTDPDKLVDHDKFDRLEKKLSACMTKMFRKPENGGNPFLFALSASKPHKLVSAEFFGVKKDMKMPDGSPMHGTAATNGKEYYWDPDFLDRLDTDDVPKVMYHEALHVIFFHCFRLIAANRRIANWAFDYVVNASIEVNHQHHNIPGQCWGGSLGEPISFNALLDYIDAVTDEGFGDKPRIFADVTLHGRSPESIYAEIMNHMDKSPRKCKKCGALSIDPKTKKPKDPGPCDPILRGQFSCKHNGMCCPECGCPIDTSGAGYGDGLPAGIDSHIGSELSKTEVMTETQRAAERMKSMRGTVPSDIAEALGELMNPTLSATDIIRSVCMKKVQDSGMLNDWKRFRRRFINPTKGRMRQYLPKRYTHRARWLAMLDTSGSMSQDDLIYGVSQLQSLTGTDGMIVSCDASVHWESLTPVKNKQDLTRTKVVGRGGTVFDDFFKEFPNKVGSDFDCIVILTDGDCGTIPMELQPRCDVVWIITRGGRDFKPSFGRVAPLRKERM